MKSTNIIESLYFHQPLILFIERDQEWNYIRYNYLTADHMRVSALHRAPKCRLFKHALRIH